MWVYPEISSLDDIPRYHACLRPNESAIVGGDDKLSWRDLDLASNRMANALLASDLDRECCIGFLGKNTPFVAVALFAAAKAGMTFMPLNWRLAAAEIASILRDSECRVMFVETEFLELTRDSIARANVGPPIVTFGGDAKEAELEAFYGEATNIDPAVAVPMTVTALRVYTSGTTGLPKGVELSHENFNMTRLCEHLEPAIPWSPTTCS